MLAKFTQPEKLLGPLICSLCERHISKSVPPIPIHSFFKNVEVPSAKKEGFTQVLSVTFQADTFDNA